MLSPSDFNNAVPQFTNGDYASNPINPKYVEEPKAVDYNRGAEPLQTLPAQWWNWFINRFTNRFNKVNIYVKNIFNELTQLLSLVSETPSGTESTPTVGQMKDMFETKYPDYLKTTPALSNTYVPQTTRVNGHELCENITITCVACAGRDGSGCAFGSAAGKTAGSAAGNVPLVGTALGTTDNNIVVTDASGKLKPSGTAIGTAAGKTAGSAAGNVPLVGTALGTTNNNIVVTDASGKLKPSGTAIGSAAGKTAGSAAGNVPLVGTELGTTNNNIVVTDASGKVKPFGKTPDQIAYWGNGGGVCATAAATGAKTVSISGFTLYTGVTVKVMFTNGNSNNAPTLNVNSTGAKNIKVVKAGTKITPPVHTGKWRGASSATTEAWQPLTTLELMYDGTDWVIIGNPVVEDYYSANQSYTVYANGKIEQWVSYINTVAGNYEIPLYISMSNTNYIVTGTYYVDAEGANYTYAVKIRTKSTNKFKAYQNVTCDYIIIGF